MTPLLTPRSFPLLDPLEALTRRQLLTAIPGLVILAGGVSCGSDDNDDGPTPSGTPGTGSPAAGDFPVTIEHPLGTTTIPAEPKRVVAVNDGAALEHLLAIGVTPQLYGQTPGYDGQGKLGPWVVEAGGDKVPNYAMQRGEPDLERMTAANPDLIVGAWITPDQYGLMSKICPTIDLINDDSVSWIEMQRMTGKAVGRSQQAEDAIAETQAAIADAAKQLEPYKGRRVTVAYVFFNELYIHGENTPFARTIKQFGIDIDGPSPDELTVLSLEHISDLQDADILISPWFFEDDRTAFETSPLAQSIPAIKEGRYVPLSIDVANAGYNETTLSVRWIAPQLADAIKTGAEGNGTKL